MLLTDTTHTAGKKSGVEIGLPLLGKGCISAATGIFLTTEIIAILHGS